MIKYEWVDFTIEDLSFDEEITFTQEKFEEMANDKFVAVQVDDEGFPEYIWTEKYVFGILNKVRFMGQLAIAGFPRNPESNFHMEKK